MDTMTYASLAAIPGRLAQKNKQPVPPEIELTPLDLSQVTSNSVKQSFVRPKISHGQSRWIRTRPTWALSQAPKAKHLPRTYFRVARMVHRFVATSPTLYLFGAVLFSFCALLVAFSL